jgi:hypothetical protein
MSSIVIGQSYTIKSTVSINLVDATVYVRYLIPNTNSVQQILATTNLDTNSISASISSAINNTLGRWKFWLYVIYSDSTVYISKSVVVDVIEEG